MAEQDGIIIRLAVRADIPALDSALRALSRALGDQHRATPQGLLEAGFGPAPTFRAMLALRDGVSVGAALVSPFYSTSRGLAGAFVSDLWVADSMRGQRLGVRLLAAARDMARREWGAGFIRLCVYDDNRRARAFYERLGFAPTSGETCLTLAGAALDALEERE